MKSILKTFALGFSTGAISAFAIVIILLVVFNFFYNLISPDVNFLLTHTGPESTKIYSRDGALLYEIYKTQKRTPIALDKISPHLISATVAIEDKQFYQHRGISLGSLIRSAVVDYYLRDAAYGGSTITQQLVKNTLLSSEKSFSRKIAEIFWAFELENKLPKEKILELYLNQISYGRNAYGIEAASKAYFDKLASDLTIAESAYLAALPQAPSLYSPSGANRKTLDGRKDYILKLMKEQGYITDSQYQDAISEQVVFKTAGNSISAPYFVMWIKQILIQKYGEQKIYEGGLKVYTTLDSNLQTIAEKTIKEGVAKNIKNHYAHNAALVAIDVKTDQILAMVGGKDYFMNPQPSGCQPGRNCFFEPNVNVAVSPRQPGSSFKPYVYITAFSPENGYAPSSFVLDVTKNFSPPGAPIYIPHNYNGAQYGKIPMRKALAGSLNISAVRTALMVGTDSVVATAKSMGISTPLSNCGLSLALGSCEITLLDHVAAFSIFANNGQKNPVTGILKIEDSKNNVIEEYSAKNEQILDPQSVYELVSIMTDNKSREFIFGPTKQLTLPDRPVAAKTGTTQNWKDGWTVGFTPSLAVGVWAGNNDGTIMAPGSDGIYVAAPIWKNFFIEATKDTPVENFTVPSGIQILPVNPKTGKPAKQGEKFSAQEVFSEFAIAKMQEAPKPVNDVARAIDIPKEPADTIFAPAEITQEPLPEAIIISPSIYQTISLIPFDVSVNVSAVNTNGLRVELLIDGRFIEEKTEGPYIFPVWNALQNGTHTITVRAVNKSGTGKNYSVPVNLNLLAPEQ